MKRVLLQASVYRKFVFQTQEDLDEYLRSGHQERWLVKSEPLSCDRIVAVIGESYNNNWKLEMEEVS